MIYLCIPAHNEEQTVGVVLWKIRQVMAELQRDYQLLVADDASTDRTQDVLEPYTRVLPLTVLRNAQRRGYAASLEMLLREAVGRSDYPKRDVIITLQADFTDEPGHVGTLVKRIESGADIVTSNMLPLLAGSRLVRWRRPALNALLRRLGWPDDVRDPLNGFAAYRVFCVRRALEERKDGRLLRHDGWTANAELLRLAAPHARRVDVVEQQPHPERLQRESRFQLMVALKQVLGLRRGRAHESALPVAELRPASVLGGPSNQRSLVAESLRNGTSNASGSGPQERPRRNGGGQRPQRSGPASRTSAGDRPRRPARGDAQSRSAEGGPRGREAESSRPRPSSRDAAGSPKGRTGAQSRRREPARSESASTPASANETQADARLDPAALAQDGVAGGEAGRPKKRSRRGRRGGSGRTHAAPDSAAAPGPDAGMLAPDHSASGGEPAPEQDQSTSPDGATAEAEAGSTRRRRPNRRGGRGRRRRTNGEATPAQEGVDDAARAVEPASEAAPEPEAR